MPQKYRVTYNVSVTKEAFVFADNDESADALADNLSPTDFTTVKNSEDWVYLGAETPTLPRILNYNGKPISAIGYFDGSQWSLKCANTLREGVIRWMKDVDFGSYASLARDSIELVEQALDMMGRKDDTVFVLLTTDNQLLVLDDYNLLTD